MFKRSFVLLVLLVLALSMIGSAGAQEGGMPSYGDLAEGWTTISPGGETLCAPGTPYSFHVRPAESDNLLIYFNGGGACWFGLTCDVSVEPTTYVPLAELPHNDPRGHAGIFDLENEENPFVDYNMVFVSYCTGDVHIGGGEVTYQVPETEGMEAHEVTIYHNGYVNSMSALNWVFDNIENPGQIFVTGSSAGAIASPLYAGIVAEQYPDATIIQLGDGAGGYRAETVTGVFAAWRTADILPAWFDDADATTFTIEDLYIETGEEFPDIEFAQYNTAEDETQYGFLGLLGVTDAALLDLQLANYADIEAEIGEMPTYTAGGSFHTILRTELFYLYEVEGVRFVDWISAYAAGEMVEDVQCDIESGDCQEAPYEMEEMEGEDAEES